LPKFHYIYMDLSGGEWAPDLEGRIDLPRYARSVKEMTNFIAKKQGGAIRRGGWHFADETKYQDRMAKLIPFIFGTEQAYAIEVGDLYMRFFMDGFLIRNPTGNNLITNNTFHTGISDWTDLSVSPGFIQWDGGTERMELNGGEGGIGWTEQGISTTVGKTYQLYFGNYNNSLILRIGTTSGGSEILQDTEFDPGWYPFRMTNFKATTTTTYIQFRRTSIGGSQLDDPSCKEYEVVEKVSPYPLAKLRQIRWTQDANILYLACSGYKPYQLTRTSHIAWTLAAMDFIDGPYMDEVTTSTITPSATTGSINLVASAAMFYSGHVGALWRIKHGSTWGYVQITAVSDTTHAAATVKKTLGGTTASVAHCEGAWSDYRGWPRAVAFWQGRLYFAGSDSFPHTAWGSKVGKPLEFTPGTLDDDPVTFYCYSAKVNSILWLAASRSIMAGTLGGEFNIRGAEGGPLTPTAPDVRNDSTCGVADAMPVRVGNSVLFIQYSQKKVMELVYAWDQDAYNASDLCVLSDHIAEPGLIEIDWQQEPFCVLWAVRSDGVPIACTYEKISDTVGWHQHPTDGEVESLCVIPNVSILEDQPWATIKRTINGQTKRFVEYLDPDLNCDCALTYSGEATSNIYGLNHLIGEEVDIVGDGAVYPTQVVAADGSLTLDLPASQIQAGLHYQSKIITQRPEIATPYGTTQGVQKRWSDVRVRLVDTSGIQINGEQIPFRQVEDLMDQGVEPFTGDKRITNLGWDPDGRIEIVQDEPLPAHVVCVYGSLEIGIGG
jgi:hypothetical protein